MRAGIIEKYEDWTILIKMRSFELPEEKSDEIAWKIRFS